MGEFNGKDLKATHSVIKLNSSGDIIVIPLNSVDIESDGFGTVNLKGDAVLEMASIELSSSGDVSTEKVKAKVLSVHQTGMGECDIKSVMGNKPKF